MNLGEQDLERIGEYVRKQLPAWIEQAAVLRPAPDAVLLERMVRVEEAIRNTQELMRIEFKSIAGRFEAVDKRFEAVDKRFEELLHYMDKRFEAVDKRFEAVDKRFDDQLHYMDKRFEAVDTRFAEMQASFKRTQWFIGAATLLLTTVMSLYRFLG